MADKVNNEEVKKQLIKMIENGEISTELITEIVDGREEGCKDE